MPHPSLASQGRRATRRLIVYVCLVVGASVVLFNRRPDGLDSLDLTDVRLPNGARLTMALARTPGERTRGLSGRDRPRADGLLLLWPSVDRHPVWMRDMRFPLDLIWCDANGRVLAIKTHVAPCSASGECPLHGATLAGVRAVLELPAGRVEHLELHVDDHITAPVLTP